MVATADGRATTYALGELQSRGSFFVEPGADVYGGMVVGEYTRCAGWYEGFREGVGWRKGERGCGWTRGMATAASPRKPMGG